MLHSKNIYFPEFHTRLKMKTNQADERIKHATMSLQVAANFAWSFLATKVETEQDQFKIGNNEISRYLEVFS